MDNLNQALRGARHAVAPPLPALTSAIVVGAGGTLGSAVLAEALVAGRFQRVAAVVTGPLASALRGLQPVTWAQLQRAADIGCDTAFLVFERERHSNGRDEAFHRPEPADLLPLATALHAAGVRRLLVVVPHAPALLPHALKAGFASRDEGAVAALGFDQLVFVRAAQTAGLATVGGSLERFAAWWLSQLRWMVPAADQPVRAVKLAQLVVQLGRRLDGAPPGTRVLPPDVLQQAAQADDPDLALSAWLAPPRP